MVTVNIIVIAIALILGCAGAETPVRLREAEPAKTEPVKNTPKTQIKFDNAAIYIFERDGYLHLTVPVSRLELHIQKKGFVSAPPKLRGASESPRYFLFYDTSRQIGLSGWFESDMRFKGARTLWEEELANSLSELARARDVVFADCAGWQTISYNLEAPDGWIAHLKAHWVQSGTWIELHLSAQDNRPLMERHAFLLELLSSFRVLEKAGMPDATSVKIPNKKWQVQIDLPSTQKVYIYDMKEPGSPGYGIEGAMLVARVGAGAVTLLSYPLSPHKDCNAAIFNKMIGLAAAKSVDPKTVKFSKRERYSVHQYIRQDVQTKYWDAVFPIEELCLNLAISMPKQTKDDDSVVTNIIESLDVTK